MNKKPISECDHSADNAIKAMIASCMALATIPAQVNLAFIASAMGAGVVSIGLCYDVKLSKDEAWKLVKQFFLGAGAMFVMVNIGQKIFTMLLASTGVGYFGAAAMDAVVSGAQGYAVGACAKEYFRRDYLGQGKPTKNELGQIFREAFLKRKNESK